MSPRQLPQWRTWTGILVLGLMMLLALLIVRNSPMGSVQLPAVIGGLAGLGAALSFKSGWEHASNAKAAPPTGTPPPV